MGGVQTSLIALVTAGALATVGWAAIHTMRAGFDYMSSRGNPRNRAQAHESMRDIVVGIVLVGGATAVATFLVNTIHFTS